jgi:hypothetical protein
MHMFFWNVPGAEGREFSSRNSYGVSFPKAKGTYDKSGTAFVVQSRVRLIRQLADNKVRSQHNRSRVFFL